MKTRVLGPVFLAVALVALVACGGSNNSSKQQATATGTWAANLTNATTGQQSLAFNVNMNQNGNNLSFSGMNMLNGDNCFSSGSFVSGQMMASGMMSAGMQMGMTMNIWSNSNQTGNHMVIQTEMPLGNNNQMTGSYTLTGVTSDCSSQTGTVTMTRS
jgi:hypothetical protein